MNAIKFSQRYYKMPDGGFDSRATMLLQVLTADRSELSEEYASYDTAFGTLHGTEYYPLPKGKLLILLLKTGNDLWTTIRRHTPEKEIYYRGLQGQAVSIVIE